MYQEKKFSLPALEGISKELVDAHLGLYGGYVKNTNALSTLLEDLRKDTAQHTTAIAEAVRRFAFEWDGMRMHELYFDQWEHGAKELADNDPLHKALTKQFGSFAAWEQQFRSVGMMRGVGWAVLYYDPAQEAFINVWVDEHMQGHLVSLPAICVLDVWEHAYLAQFGTGGRSVYIDAFFKNLNWSVMSERFAALS